MTNNNEIDILQKTSEKHIDKGEYSKALGCLDKVLAANGTNPQVLKKIAFVKRELGYDFEANQTLQTALKLSQEKDEDGFKDKFNMRDEIIKKLETAIKAVEYSTDIESIGIVLIDSMMRFEMLLDTQSLMTENEFNQGFYDKWLSKEHSRLYDKFNKEYKLSDNGVVRRG